MWKSTNDVVAMLRVWRDAATLARETKMNCDQEQRLTGLSGLTTIDMSFVQFLAARAYGEKGVKDGRYEYSAPNSNLECPAWCEIGEFHRAIRKEARKASHWTQAGFTFMADATEAEADDASRV